jgi:hypothetical protein
MSNSTDSVHPVFYTRHYKLTTGGEVRLDVTSPERFEDSDDYVCHFRVLGLKNPVQSFAGGVDALQSLQLALMNAAAILLASEEYQRKELYWLEHGQSDLGLPIPKAFL